MTPKERWLAALHLQPVDRLPFWPKLDPAYARAQSGPFRDMATDEIHDRIGSDKHIWLPDFVKQVGQKTSVEQITEGNLRRTVFRARRRSAVMIEQFDEPSHSWHPLEFPAKTVEDVELLMEVYADLTLEVDDQALAEARAQVEQFGQDALTAQVIWKSPLMHLVELLAGIDNVHYLLTDHQDAVVRLLDTMHRVLLLRTEIYTEISPADVLYFSENTSTTLISPEQYRRFCYSHIREYGEITRAAGRILILHMCGHLKALLPDLATLPVQAFEAFTSPPVGNTRLADGRAACPDKCLIGGTNAALWTRPARDIIAEIEQDLNALPHHRGIVITSAGVMPPLCRPQTIRQVGEWVRAYRPQM